MVHYQENIRRKTQTIKNKNKETRKLTNSDIKKLSPVKKKQYKNVYKKNKHKMQITNSLWTDQSFSII